MEFRDNRYFRVKLTFNANLYKSHFPAIFEDFIKWDCSRIFKKWHRVRTCDIEYLDEGEEICRLIRKVNRRSK